MNIEKLKNAERQFLMTYPEGFESPEMVEIGKKHKMEKLIEYAKAHFGPSAFEDTHGMLESMIQLVNKSSMVSIFEKPKFRDALKSFSDEERKRAVLGLFELLHDDEALGFQMLVDVLSPYGIAKWPILTVFGCYYHPHRDLLFKPTTVKGVLSYFEIEDIKYSAKPTYAFFVAYRDHINQMKKAVSPMLSPNNAAFSGFLMVSMV